MGRALHWESIGFVRVGVEKRGHAWSHQLRASSSCYVAGERRVTCPSPQAKCQIPQKPLSPGIKIPRYYITAANRWWCLCATVLQHTTTLCIIILDGPFLSKIRVLPLSTYSYIFLPSIYKKTKPYYLFLLTCKTSISTAYYHLPLAISLDMQGVHLSSPLSFAIKVH
jgi:hypothetical protein